MLDRNLTPTWQKAPERLVLCAQEIHIWAVDGADLAAQLGAYTRVLSADERLRAERFQVEQARIQFVLGRAILRILLGRYLDLEPQAIALVYGLKGKPVVAQTQLPKGFETLQFSLAHSADLVLLAFGLAYRLGVDCEQQRLIKDQARLVQRFFSRFEAVAFAQLSQAQQDEAFLTLWTSKEAYLKACGVGLSHSLHACEVAWSSTAPACFHAIEQDTRLAQQWSLWTLEPKPGYRAALAVENKQQAIRLMHFAYPGIRV